MFFYSELFDEELTNCPNVVNIVIQKPSFSLKTSTAPKNCNRAGIRNMICVPSRRWVLWCYDVPGPRRPCFKHASCINVIDSRCGGTMARAWDWKVSDESLSWNCCSFTRLGITADFWYTSRLLDYFTQDIDCSCRAYHLGFHRMSGIAQTHRHLLTM